MDNSKKSQDYDYDDDANEDVKDRDNNNSTHTHALHNKKSLAFLLRIFLSLSSSWTVVALRCYAAAALKWDSLCHFWILLRFCHTFFSEKNAFTVFYFLIKIFAAFYVLKNL